MLKKRLHAKAFITTINITNIVHTKIHLCEISSTFLMFVNNIVLLLQQGRELGYCGLVFSSGNIWFSSTTKYSLDATLCIIK